MKSRRCSQYFDYACLALLCAASLTAGSLKASQHDHDAAVPELCTAQNYRIQQDSAAPSLVDIACRRKKHYFLPVAPSVSMPFNSHAARMHCPTLRQQWTGCIVLNCTGQGQVQPSRDTAALNIGQTNQHDSLAKDSQALAASRVYPKHPDCQHPQEKKTT